MTDVINATQIEWVQVFLGALVLLVAARFILEIIDYFKKKFGFTTTTDRRNTNIDTTIEKVEGIIETINKISDKQNSIEERLTKIEESNQSYRQNDTRNEILKLYRYYCNDHTNPMKAWTQIEHDGFEQLYNEYDKNNGNGFVHGTIYPEMMALTVIQMSQTADIAALYASRGRQSMN